MASTSWDVFVNEILNMSREATDFGNFLNKLGDRLRLELGADRAIVKDMRPGVKASAAEDFVLNNEKPYLDNRLSGYSAFKELIEYHNSGYKSSLLLPLSAERRSFGIITLLSKREDAFSEKIVDHISLALNSLSYRILASYERDKSLGLAKYFDASFGNYVPQLVIDGSGVIVKANKNAINMLDKISEEVVGQGITKFIELGQDPSASFSKNMRIEVKSRDDKGVFLFSSNKINDRLSHISLLDITRLKWLEGMYSFLERSDEDVFMRISNDTNIGWVSDNADRVLRIEKDALIGRKLVEFVQGLDEQQLSNMNEQASLPLKINIGNNMFVDAKGLFYKDVEGFSVIVSRDIESRITEVEGAISTIMKLSSDTLITVDESGYIKSVNPGFERRLGYKAEDSNSMPISMLCSDKESQLRVGNAIKLAKVNGFVTDVFLNFSKKSGEEPMPFNGSVMATKNREASVEFLFVCTELASKREIERLQSEFEESMRQLEKLKEESDLKTQFIYNISHDLKTPITNIIGFSKLLIGGEFGDITQDQKKTVQIIIDESERLMQLIGQILDVAKLSSGKIKLDMQKVDFKMLGENPSIKSLAEVAANKNLRFYFNVGYNVPEIEADPNRLIQVFVNLIGNALKFTDEGSIGVNVVRKGKNIRFEVQDTGIGISKEDKSKLFKKFYQLPKRGLTRQEGQGTGLGLSIAKEVVNLHGGRMGVVSESGKGSTFWFTLPIYGKQKKKQE